MRLFKEPFPLTIGGLVLSVVLHAGTALTGENTAKYFGITGAFPEIIHALLVFLLICLYFFALIRLRSGYTLRLQHLLLVLVLSSAPYFINFATRSSDIFIYISYAEVSQHSSPYLQGADSLGPGNPIYYGVWKQWRPHPSPYGPVWMAVVILIGKLHASLVTQLLIFKILGAAALAIIASLLVRWRSLPAAAMVLLNPILIIDLVGDGHNDGLFAALILFSVISFRKSILSGISYGLSIATKHVSLFLAPILLAASIQQGKQRKTLFMVASSIIALLCSYGFMWAGPKMFNGLLVIGFQFFGTPIFFPQSIFFSVLRVVFPSLTVYTALQFASYIGLSFTVLCVGWISYRMWQKKIEVPTAVFYALCAVIFLSLQWVQPWYLLWPLVLTPFLGRKTAFRSLLILTLVWFAMFYTSY